MTHVPDPELPPLTDPGDGDGALLMFEERVLMYLTGHRLGDLRRLVRHYVDPEEVFPTGAYHKGGRRSGRRAPVDFEEATTRTSSWRFAREVGLTDGSRLRVVGGHRATGAPCFSRDRGAVVCRADRPS